MQSLAKFSDGLLHRVLPHEPSAQEASRQCPLGEEGVSRVPVGRAGVHEDKGADHAVWRPYGARARMILLYLQTQAVKTKSREVELGRSMWGWLERMGVAYGGETAKALREQAARISACNLKFFWDDERGVDGWSAARIVASGLRFHTLATDGQENLWEDRVELDPVFFKALADHPVPLLEAAIRQLRDRSMSLDLYVWLAWRLQTLSRATPISWPAIFGQFGEGYRELYHFKPRFTDALAAAVAAYPEARIELGEAGIVLHPSRPPVSKTTMVSIA